jgi:hypothetical protein
MGEWTDLPPLPFSIVVLEQSLVVWNSVFTIDEAVQRMSARGSCTDRTHGEVVAG